MLTLPIKKKWFDMIKSGEKREEYRKLSPHYKSIFYKYLGLPVRVRFRNGYRKDSPTIERTIIPHYGYGRPEWGAEPNKEYFVLTIQPEGKDLKNDLSVL